MGRHSYRDKPTGKSALPAMACPLTSRSLNARTSCQRNRIGHNDNDYHQRLQIYYKDWGTDTVPRAERLPLSIRRGHGRSGQASAHNDMDGYAGDLIAGFQWSHRKQGRREVPN